MRDRRLGGPDMTHDLQCLESADWRSGALTHDELRRLERLLDELEGRARGASFADLALALELELALA
jgi:hypothetical protein